MVIFSKFVNDVASISKGKEFVCILIKLEMIDHFLGGFASTKRLMSHTKAGRGTTPSSSAYSLK
jgi:ribosomal protein S19